MPEQPVSQFKAWVGAMRLRTLPLAASSSIAGSALAWKSSTNWSAIFLLALLTTLLLQILSNLANDYGDFSNGLDNESRIGPQRALQSGVIQMLAMKKALYLFVALSFISGILLLYVSFATEQMFGKALLFFVFGIATIAAALRYTTGKNPYGYRGLGDVFVFLFFGLVGVCGTAFLHLKYFDPASLIPSVTVGLLSTAVLNLNNLRDHENDRSGGKNTIIVRIGFKNGKIYHTGLIAVAMIAISALIFRFPERPEIWLMLIPFALLVRHLIVVFRTADPAALDPELKKVALTTFVYSLILLLIQLLSDLSSVNN